MTTRIGDTVMVHVAPGRSQSYDSLGEWRPGIVHRIDPDGSIFAVFFVYSLIEMFGVKVAPDARAFPPGEWRLRADE